MAQPALPPDMVLFRDELARAYRVHGPMAGLPMAHARAIAEAVRAPWAHGGPAMLRSVDRSMALEGRALRARFHVPSARPDGVLAHAHGGGWTLFSVDTHDRVMREYAARANAVVAGPDSSLAPEAQFPRPVFELAALLRLLHAAAAGIEGLDMGGLPLAVGGDSAGGNLALAAAIVLRDAGEGDVLRAILANYAALDPRQDRDSYRMYDGPAFNLGAAEMRRFWDGYVPAVAMRDEPLASPLRARLAGLPPTFVTIAECDVLAAENHELAARLTEANVRTRAVVYPGMLHSFLEAVSVSPVAAKAFADGAAWLRAAFGVGAWPTDTVPISEK